MLDVLIVGGGPHALTLATLLAHPDVCCTQPGTDILDGIQLSQPKSKSGWSKSKRRPTAVEMTKEEAVPGPAPTPPLHFRVVDSFGKWAALWGSQFSALNIPHLRSHTLVHSDPLNKKALQDFVVRHGRSGELYCLPDQVCILDKNTYFNDNRLGKRDKRRLSTSVGMRKNLYFSLPATQLSVDFFQDQVHRYGLENILIKGTVDRIIPVMASQSTIPEGPGKHREALSFRVFLQDGEIIEARRVVMATGPTRAPMANIPAWVSAITESYPEDRLQHTAQLMHWQAHSRHREAGTQQQEEEILQQGGGTKKQGKGSQQKQEGSQKQEAGTQQQESRPNSPVLPPVCHSGERMLVIGGGLTSAHIIAIALQQGASHVTWVIRKHLQLKQFDVGDVESLIGRYSHVEHGIQLDGRAYLRQFYNERSFTRRLAMIRQARKGGAVTPEAYTHLLPYIQDGRLAVKPYCQVSEAKWCYRNQAWSTSLSCGESWIGDRIWLATGCKLDVKQDPLLADVIKEFPIQDLDGWPCLMENLQWAPGCPLYLMGQYSALQIGPHAVNLAGGQASSMRIAKDILNWRRGIRGGHREERTRTEEYIQQMHGLMWL